MLEKIRIILIHTSHPGNIGAAARAMKTMGLCQLTLVAPKYFPHAESSARASGADDILARAVVTESLTEALAGVSLVVGTSARLRHLASPVYELRAGCQQIAKDVSQGDIAILFGEERTGLTNEQLDKCHYFLNIDTDATFSSLNLAAAVQVVAYELRQQCCVCQPLPESTIPLASADEMEGFYQHLESTLIKTTFLDPHSPKRLMSRLRRLYNRARIEQREIHILRGILKSIEQCRGEYER